MANIDNLTRQLPGMAVGAVAAGAATYLLSPDLPAWAIDIIKQVGPFAVLLLVAMWYVPRQAVPAFLKTQQDQAVALSSLAEAVKTLPQKDDMKFESILIGQEMLNREVRRLHDRFDAIAEKINGQA